MSGQPVTPGSAAGPFAAMEKALRDAMNTGSRPATIAVAGARGVEVFTAIAEAVSRGIARFILTGDEESMRQEASAQGLDEELEYLQADDDEKAAAVAVGQLSSGRADALMKGKVPTPVLLKALLNARSDTEHDQLLSHILVLETPEGRLLGVSDGGMNIRPDAGQKKQIVRSAVELFRNLGIEKPKVAVLAAMEVENPKMPESVEAAEVRRGWEAGEIPDCELEGPVALDLAVSPQACRLKGWSGRIQGDADILIAHDISAGNILGKSLIYCAGYSGGGLILGAEKPVILLSRSDSSREKYNSILLALYSRMHLSTQGART